MNILNRNKSNIPKTNEYSNILQTNLTVQLLVDGILQHDLDLRFVPRVMLGTSISLAYQVLCLGQV